MPQSVASTSGAFGSDVRLQKDLFEELFAWVMVGSFGLAKMELLNRMPAFCSLVKLFRLLCFSFES